MKIIPAKFEYDWSKSHCGVMACSFYQTFKFMPEVSPILDMLLPHLETPFTEYVVDVKVAMLMPNQWACIPNWHKDFVPRDENNIEQESLITGEKIYLWVSGPPLTEFKDRFGNIRTYNPQHWIQFTQNDVHRGSMCTEFIWRCFIRVMPKKFLYKNTKNINQLRRHNQVYLDVNNFRW